MLRRGYRAIRRAQTGDRVRTIGGYGSSGRSHASSQHGYETPTMSMGNPLGGLTGYLDEQNGRTGERSYGTDSGASAQAGGGSSSGAPSDAQATLFGRSYGSEERPEILLRQKSDRLRDRMSRREFRASKKGQTYNPDQDFGIAGKIQDARKARLEKKLDKTTDAMLDSGQEAAQLQRERVAKDVKNIDIVDDLNKELGMMGVESKSYTSPKAGYQLPTEESAEEKKAFKKTERLDKKRDRIENRLNNLAQPQSMQSKYQRALKVEDDKELMRKKQGRYGWPYTEDMNLLPEHQKAYDQIKAGENVTNRPFGHYTMDKQGQVYNKMYAPFMQPSGQPGATSIASNVLDDLSSYGNDKGWGKKNRNGGRIRGYRAIRR